VSDASIRVCSRILGEKMGKAENVPDVSAAAQKPHFVFFHPAVLFLSDIHTSAVGHDFLTRDDDM
jgi:hypothetical protein